MTVRIGITGGKGGTGKSTVATALAHHLAGSSKVLLVDADVDCPNDHLLLSAELAEQSTVKQRVPKIDSKICSTCAKCGTVCRSNALLAVKGRLPILMKAQCNGCGACEIICPEDAISYEEKVVGWIRRGRAFGIDILSGELKTTEPVSELVVNRLIEAIPNGYDQVIIDTAAGTHCPVIAALEPCDIVFAVTEPTPLGSHDLSLILHLLNELGKTAYVIVNRSDIGDRSLVPDSLVQIPYSEEIMKDYSRGIPISGPWLDKIAEVFR